MVYNRVLLAELEKKANISTLSNILSFYLKEEEKMFFLKSQKEMNRNGIDDQNNDNIIDEPQDILEEGVEDDDNNI